METIYKLKNNYWIRLETVWLKGEITHYYQFLILPQSCLKFGKGECHFQQSDRKLKGASSPTPCTVFPGFLAPVTCCRGIIKHLLCSVCARVIWPYAHVCIQYCKQAVIEIVSRYKFNYNLLKADNGQITKSFHTLGFLAIYLFTF